MPDTFAFRFDRSHQLAALPFGVTPATTRVTVDDTVLAIRFGPWSLTLPLANVAGAQVTGPYSFLRTAGPARLSLADRGVTFATSAGPGLCIRFHEPVPAIEPSGRLRHPGATVTVADPEGLARRLSGSL